MTLPATEFFLPDNICIIILSFSLQVKSLFVVFFLPITVDGGMLKSKVLQVQRIIVPGYIESLVTDLLLITKHLSVNLNHSDKF